jgi:hypothetical protein
MLQRQAHHDKIALDGMASTIPHWMRFFAALRMTCACGDVYRRRFALDRLGGAGGGSKAAAEPPHSKMSWAASGIQTLGDPKRCGQRRSARTGFVLRW